MTLSEEQRFNPGAAVEDPAPHPPPTRCRWWCFSFNLLNVGARGSPGLDPVGEQS